MDPYTNFAWSTVQAGSTIIGSTATPKTVVLRTGDGANFPGGDGVTQFNVIIWPSDEQPNPANAEFVRCTRSGDTLTTTARGQDGTSAKSSFVAGYQVAQVVSKKMLDDLVALIPTSAAGLSNGVSGSGAIVLATGATLASPTLTTPTIGSFANATHDHSNATGGGQLTESALNLSDVTTANASATKHGFLPKLANDTTKFLRSDGTYQVPPGASGFSTGDYKLSAQAADHGSWLLCDGSAKSRATYAALFALIGTNFGVGDGSTTFNLPDARGRAGYAKGTHADVDALNDSDGQAVANRTPKHNTTITDPGHHHAYGENNVVASGTGSFKAGITVNQNYQNTANATTGITAGPGGSRPTDMPSYIVLGNRFIYAG